MVDASELIANALERSAMTRRELAGALGIDEADVTACLVGEKDLGVKQLAKALHIMGERLVLKSSIPNER